VEKRNCKILPVESPYLYKVSQNDASGRFQVRRVERGRYRREAVSETNLPVGKRNTIPVQSVQRFDFPQSKIKAVKGLGRKGYDKVPCTIN